MTDQEIYQQVCEHNKETQLLRTTSALLDWDHQTKLPKQAAAYRSEQSTYLAGKIHERNTDVRLGEWLETLVTSEWGGDEHSAERATVREMHHHYKKSAKLPMELVQAISRACSIGQSEWVEARANNDFKKFAPHLKEIFRLKREEAQVVGESDRLYDALLDDYEPGAKTQVVAEVLGALKEDLIPLIQLANENRERVDGSVLRGSFPRAEQEALGRKVVEAIGFDMERGRLDVAPHPFCTKTGPNDCRITARYDESFLNTSFFVTIHEAGHGLYEQGLPTEHYGLPAGSSCSLGIHESQSRMWENLVGRSRGFWSHFYPITQSMFPEQLSSVAQQDFWAAINEVRPSLIRVEADEATYNLHIIIRFELEEALLNQELDVDDLPTAWNEKYQQALGIQPDSDANGVLQDIHWSVGSVGYFPTYSLGNIYASQLFQQAKEDLGDLEEAFSRGEFTPLLDWLRKKIHHCGSCWRAPQLMERIVGKPLDHQPLVSHLKNKIESVYLSSEPTS